MADPKDECSDNHSGGLAEGAGVVLTLPGGVGVPVVTGVPAPEAWLSQDGRTVHLRRGGWTGSFAVEELGEWLRFYRGLRDRKDGRFSVYYAQTVRELEKLEARLRAKC